MNHLKVMIVDDEILAIEHLKRLVHWEGLGFTVAGETVHPRKGLELAAKLKPDLIFVDIRMPGMDGLILSERLAEAGSQAKIVILTSYKEFEYVKQSLRIGVHDYWVKHELTPETLTLELEKLRDTIDKDKAIQRKMSKTLLEQAKAGKELSNEELKALANYMASFGSQYVYIALEFDTPYPAVGRPMVTRDTGIQMPWGVEDGTKYRWIETFTIAAEGTRIGVLLGFDGMVSRRQLHEELFQWSAHLKQAYSEHVSSIGGTVSVACSSVFQEATGLFAAAAWADRALDLRIFTGMDSVLMYSEEKEGTISAADSQETDWEAWIHRLRHYTEEHRLAEVEEEIDAMFTLVKKMARLEELRMLCNELSKELDRLRMSKGRSAFRDEPYRDIEGSDDWTSVSGIARWFKKQFRAAMEDEHRDVYSAKVRKAIQYINRHYAKDLSTEQIAAHLAISGDHLRHCFKNETGRTILDYLTEVRMEKAKRYLATGQYKLYEVAEKVGYRNSHYFSKVFQRVTGQHPLEYSERKQYHDE
ncbi:transcriptional regulator, AraC family [Paenibacillus sp. oral taxon 786 str. D14]|uniref:response regulator transcription factor n=1 Tax=Paenibacillus sp. oral taxon 786 TaxID=652715 RepID=UPI0001AFD6A9|nr:helix-turn-helix domain-containing protein [Paenibacillus sp. oral taxon 786]EES72899.1 transcriptional regulator, AraC family [Paenibacillus sp. oral taxon 786 str. D14]